MSPRKIEEMMKNVQRKEQFLKAKILRKFRSCTDEVFIGMYLHAEQSLSELTQEIHKELNEFLKNKLPNLLLFFESVMKIYGQCNQIFQEQALSSVQKIGFPDEELSDAAGLFFYSQTIKLRCQRRYIEFTHLLYLVVAAYLRNKEILNLWTVGSLSTIQTILVQRNNTLLEHVKDIHSTLDLIFSKKIVQYNMNEYSKMLLDWRGLAVKALLIEKSIYNVEKQKELSEKNKEILESIRLRKPAEAAYLLTASESKSDATATRVSVDIPELLFRDQSSKESKLEQSEIFNLDELIKEYETIQEQVLIVSKNPMIYNTEELQMLAFYVKMLNRSFLSQGEDQFYCAYLKESLKALDLMIKESNLRNRYADKNAEELFIESLKKEWIEQKEKLKSKALKQKILKKNSKQEESKEDLFFSYKKEIRSISKEVDLEVAQDLSQKFNLAEQYFKSSEENLSRKNIALSYNMANRSHAILKEIVDSKHPHLPMVKNVLELLLASLLRVLETAKAKYEQISKAYLAIKAQGEKEGWWYEGRNKSKPSRKSEQGREAIDMLGILSNTLQAVKETQAELEENKAQKIKLEV